MRLVKLNAIPSTNDFLKEMAANQVMENFTVVVAECQTKGRGQMGATWQSEAGKNLTFSVFARDIVTDISKIFELNIIASMAIFDVLKDIVPGLSVKWPNDIMAGDKKIGGILIENTFHGSGSISSVVGIGLNVNQTHFELDTASSMAIVCGKPFDKGQILERIVSELFLKTQSDRELLKHRYEEALFRIGMLSEFTLNDGTRFTGSISGVADDGRLIVERGSETLYFALKEVALNY